MSQKLNVIIFSNLIGKEEEGEQILVVKKEDDNNSQNGNAQNNFERLLEVSLKKLENEITFDETNIEFWENFILVSLNYLFILTIPIIKGRKNNI